MNAMHNFVRSMSRRLLLLVAFFTLHSSFFTLQAQTIGEAFYIYRNDGQFNAFFRDEVISIEYSQEDADGNHYDEIVTQIVNTADSVYKIPLAAIDSIGFVQPETVYKKEAKPLVGELFDYLVKAESLILTFDPSIPTTLLPTVGDKLVATDLTDKLPLGFTGTVRQVEQTAGGYVVSCDSLLLEEVVEQFYGVVEMTGQQGDGSVRRYLPRKVNSKHTYPPFQLDIPTINQKLDLSPIIRPKDVYTINGKAVANAAISPVITGRVTRVVDNILNISHYNIHAISDVTTVTTVEAVGEVTNSDNPLNLSSPKTNFCIEGTKAGPWGIPIYYAFGPKFDMSGEIALGTTVYANFIHTEDITYYPLTTAVGVVMPGLSPLTNQFNTVSGFTSMTHFDIDWLYIVGRISARVAVVGRLGIGLAAKGKNLGWVGCEAQVGAKAEAELGFDFEALSNAEKGTGFYDGVKDNAKVTVMPYWGLEGKVSVLDDRYSFTFIGRDDYSFWGKKWEWDFLPKFSDTRATVSNGSKADVTANITNDCVIPYAVGFSLFDENNNRIGEPQWNEQKFWTRNSFNFPFKTTFTDLATDKKYKVYPTLRLLGFNVQASPSAELEMKFPVTLSDFKVTSKQHQENGFTHNGQSYDYCFNVSITATLDADVENIAEWGYVYLDPNGQEAFIPLSGHSYTDTRYAYYRNGKPPFTCTLCGYVKYVGSDEIVYGEPHDYPLEYGETTTCPDSNHPHWIDLGLPSGTLWRCCNEGASTPEDYGGHYTFEEAQAYNPPSFGQIDEFLDNTTSVWTTQNGVNGEKFTGPNGGTVFLPAAGYVWNGELYHVGTRGAYWSSTPHGVGDACGLYLPGDLVYWGFDRNFGLSVRPVR